MDRSARRRAGRDARRRQRGRGGWTARLCGREHPRPRAGRPSSSRAPRSRYLDAFYEEWRVHIEIDGGHHLDPRHAWSDMQRQNDPWIAGDRVLRFPTWAVRDAPTAVAAQIRAALLAGGWRPSQGDLGKKSP